jgi:hypothetical protein
VAEQRQSKLRVAGAALLGLVVATFATAAIRGFLSDLDWKWVAAMFVVLWIGGSYAFLWAMGERVDELAKKIPISSRELRRRKKEFYDSLK